MGTAGHESNNLHSIRYQASARTTIFHFLINESDQPQKGRLNVFRRPLRFPFCLPQVKTISPATGLFRFACSCTASRCCR